MIRKLSLAAIVPLMVIALAGCSSSPVTVVEVDPSEQTLPTVSPEPTSSASPSASPSATPVEVDNSSQRITCDGKDATIRAKGNIVKGTNGNDVIVILSLGDVTVDAGAGNDAICVYTETGETPNSVIVFGGAGNDRFYGSDGEDHFFGGSGKDEANGFGGNDVLVGGADSDKLRGGDGDDYIRGGDGSDVIGAGEGNDVIAGDAGEDTLNSENGSDIIYTDKADHNQTDANKDDSKTPPTTLAQVEAQRIQVLVGAAATAGSTVSQGSGNYAGLVIAKNAEGVVVAATPGKK